MQLWANVHDILAAAASMVEGQCDAVDLNLGCPQVKIKAKATLAHTLAPDTVQRLRSTSSVGARHTEQRALPQA